MSQELIDLSHPIHTGMQVYPGDPQVTLRRAAELETDGFEVAELHLGSHSGTHMDAPLHLIADGSPIDRIPLEHCTGPARIVHVGAPVAQSVISLAAVRSQLSGLRPGTVVLFHTGYSRHFGTDEYLRHPSLAVEIAEFLLEHGVRLLGVDTLSPDLTPISEQSEPVQLPVHEVFLGAGGLIVENLTQLHRASGTGWRFSAFPLRLRGVDGSPVRAVLTRQSAAADD
ncbi:cyclase family protein [Glutamicibacter endophyticus]